MRQLLLILLLILGCAGPPPPTCCTIRDPSVTSAEFFEMADAMVRDNFPQWYSPDVKKELLFYREAARYASVNKIEDGTLVMSIYKPSWDLCAVEDFALVLLHEYTHVVIWDRLKETIQNPDCRAAVHELFANQAELYQGQIRATPPMRQLAHFAYAKHYRLAQAYCSEGTVDIFPEPEAE